MAGFRIFAATLVGLALAACAGDPYAGSKQSTTTGSGGVTGSVPGGATGGRVAAGLALDERDREAANAAHLRALQYGEPGAPVAWRSAETGHYGTIVPGPPYQSSGLTCREYSHTIYIDGRPQIARGAACRNPDGIWTPVS